MKNNIKIRELYSQGKTAKEIGILFNLSKTTVSKICADIIRPKGRKRIFQNRKECRKSYYFYHRNEMIERGKINNQKRRRICLSHYSDEIPFCACCGEKHKEFLCIDHINGGGSKHRKEMANQNGHGGNIYHWLIKNNFPSGFQVLCHNCNMAKGFYGNCPHKQNML